MRALAAPLLDGCEDQLAACVGEVVHAALTQLVAAGVADPAVVLAAGEHCALELDRLIWLSRQRARRLRIGDSLRIEATRLLEGAMSDRPDGLDVRVIATRGEAGWAQACELALATLDAGEACGAVACAGAGKLACAFAIQVGADAEVSSAEATLVAAGEDRAHAACTDAQGTVARLARTLDRAIRSSGVGGQRATARRGKPHVRIAAPTAARLLEGAV